MAGAQDWQPYRHLWADCLDNVRSLTSHNPIGLQGLLRGQLYLDQPEGLPCRMLSHKQEADSSRTMWVDLEQISVTACGKVQ
jgi:hypothetical protein